MFDHLTWDNVVGVWDGWVGDDTPPPPTREAVEEHNRRVEETGADVPLLTFDQDVADEASEAYRRSRRSLVERVRDGARTTLQDVRDMSSTARWMSIAIVVVVVAGTVALMTWWMWIWGPRIAETLLELGA